MDFTHSPEADEAAALAARILGDRVTTATQRRVEEGGDRHSPALLAELADAGLLGLHLDEAVGGAGLGLLEACRVLIEAGRVVAPVALAGHVAGSQLLVDHGDDAQREALLPGAASGELLLVVADAEPLDHHPERPEVRASADGEGWRLDGAKTLVPAPRHAAAVLVTASTPEGAGVFLVRRDTEGVELAEQRTSDADRTGLLTLRAAAAEPVGAAGGDVVRRLRQLVTVTACAHLLGVTEGALRLTADYAATRHQFGRPIGVFQAVRHRLADGHIDLLGQRLTLWQAAWRVSEGLDADEAVAVAALWAADAAHRTAHTAVHVHGGVGIDLDGEAHRYFTAAKRAELELGGTTVRALEIGRLLAGA